MKWKLRNNLYDINDNDTIIEKIGKIRGLKNNDLLDFLNPSKKCLHNPLLLKNINIASERIIKAIQKNEKICISVDPDVDGLMSATIMYRYLKIFTNNIYYIYCERSCGHGIEGQIAYIQDNTDLLIILDSSSNSIDMCKKIKEKNIDIIIYDHHELSVLDNPYSILINPQNDDYPNKFLSGSGVAFKAIQILDEKLNSGKVWDFVDLCAIGLYADMMDVSILENRYLIIQGMKNIKNFGIKAILDIKNVKIEDINSQTIGFSIAPMLNGVARLDKLNLALELLLCDDYKECLFIAEEMLNMNEQRKKIEKQLFDTYKSKINENDKIIIITDEMASKGFNGLIANKIAQEYKKPTIVLREHKGTLAGSFRSYGDFKIKDFLKTTKLINSAEGHQASGGITLYSKNLQKFKDYINEKLANYEFESVVEYDIEIESSEITESLILDVEKINYLTGQGFPTVTFKVTGMVYDSDCRKTMGEANNHVKMSLEDITLVKFNTSSDYGLDIPDMANIEAIGQLNLNIYRTKWGKEFKTNQLLINDIRVVY